MCGPYKVRASVLKEREPVEQTIGFQSEDEIMSTAKKIVMNTVEISNTYRMSKNKKNMNGRK